ncbi:hypothetical protein [Microvirga makkahensis]|uniref:Uncharacterized protein n=1 Tax=Microvirga makkahensis TaxID=1128670 RepID=A0A7X3MVH8_9HYPH|nr:hypothetical protein [Microvirga makkahensis]MXQ14018.1 hypothetical protein [Microvirga makkahensis]
MQFISFQTASTRPSGLLGSAIRLALLTAVGIALIAVVIVGFLVVLPLMLIGGIASYIYLRRRVRQARRHAPEHATGDAIDAEYTVIDRR